MGKMPEEIVRLTHSQALLLYRTHHASRADQLHSLVEAIFAGAAPTASKDGGDIYHAVREHWREVAALARGEDAA